MNMENTKTISLYSATASHFAPRWYFFLSKFFSMVTVHKRLFMGTWMCIMQSVVGNSDVIFQFSIFVFGS